MVNVEDFSKRLKIMIDYYGISAAILAEKIKVQRSSISHILSGRNKPSLDFVLKILKAFPEVELYWLMNGVGKFPKEIENNTPSPTFENTQNSSNNMIETKIPSEKKLEIERIVIFYKDGTFKNYTA
jgi:transcriptional regulator with XRE-family HTH domain